jgi:hypothetical protein
MDEVRRVIEHRGIVFRDPDGGVPLEAVVEILSLGPEGELGRGCDFADLSRLVIVSGNRSAVAAGIDDVRVRVARVDRDIALAASDRVPS